MNKKARKNMSGEKQNAAENKIALLEQEIRNRDAFIAALIHETKAPLTSILGYSSLLQLFRTDTKEAKQALQRISSESKRLERLTQKLKCVFHLSGEESLKPEVVSISFLFEQLKNITEYMLLKRRQSLALDSGITSVTLDPELFLIALKNLVENASNASKDRTVIRLNVHKKEQTVVFCVEDRGCGMEKEQVNKLLANSMEDRSGVGFMLCKSIAQAHGASVHIESELGRGTRVLIKVP